MRYIKLLLLVLLLVIKITAAFAQSSQLNPAEQTLNQEWIAFQVSQQHVLKAIVGVSEAWRADKDTLAAERKYWADYVKGLYEHNQSMATPK